MQGGVKNPKQEEEETNKSKNVIVLKNIAATLPVLKTATAVQWSLFQKSTILVFHSLKSVKTLLKLLPTFPPSGDGVR